MTIVIEARKLNLDGDSETLSLLFFSWPLWMETQREPSEAMEPSQWIWVEL